MTLDDRAATTTRPAPPSLAMRPLGRTGLEVSEISLGTVELGLAYGLRSPDETGPPSAEQALRVLDRAIGLGVNLIDTARVYGASEELVGRAIRGRRERVIVATKVEPIPADVTGPARAARIEGSVAASLRALGTDVIDILQIHSATVEEIERGETVAVLERLRDAGAVRVIGVSTYGGDAARAALTDGRYGCLQIAYNLLDREAEDGVLGQAATQGVGIIARSVLLRGALSSRQDRLPAGLGELRAAIAALQAGLPDPDALPAIAYRYVLGDERVASALVGTSHVPELEAALRAADDGPLDEGLIERIRSITVADRAQLQPHTWPAEAGEAAGVGSATDD
ncbi:MAG TPA: aldo/keto reductase [Candidatus Limnocylindrales bacterium]